MGIGGEGNRRDANLTNREDPNCESDNRHEIERNGENDEHRGIWGDRQLGVLFAGWGNGRPSELGWGELGNYGADCEAGQYLQYSAETHRYEELLSQTDVAVFIVLAERPIFAREES